MRRDFSTLETDDYDLVVVGGGVQGIAVGLESAARGLRPLVVERADFGGMTTANTLRIVHGGLRYLQFLDYRRFRSSVDQRRWWLQQFPELVTPVACLMPLYGHGLQRPTVLRVALAANDLLSSTRNRGVRDDRRIPGGRVVRPAEALELFPGCRQEGLRGAALWTDASMVSPQRLVIEMLRWMVSAGGNALNYVSAQAADVRGGSVAGVRLRDMLTGDECRVDTKVIVNAAGPWCGPVADALGASSSLLPATAVAFNLLLRKPLPAEVTVGISSPGGGPVRFLRPVGELTFAGTVHGPAADEKPGYGSDEPSPSEAAIRGFLGELNEALPGFAATPADIVRTFAGYLPARRVGSADPLHHPVVVDHRRAGGPAGAYSVSAVKFTTAPAVARSLMDRIHGREHPADWDRMDRLRPSLRPWPVLPLRGRDPGDVEACLRGDAAGLEEIVDHEAVVFGEDLIWRRLDWTLRDADLDGAVSTVADMPELALTSLRGSLHRADGV